MSTWFNNWKTTMERNSSLAPKKDSISITLKKRRKSKKKRKLTSNPSANWWKMFLEKKLKKSLSQIESMNPHASWSLESTVGQQIWRESWKPKLWEILPWLVTWFQRKLWKSTPKMQLSRNWETKLMLIRVTRLLRTWSGFFTRPHYSLQASL